MPNKTIYHDHDPSSTQKPQTRANSMLSAWYGVLVGILQAYLIVQSVRKFIWFAELSWPYKKTPFVELNAYIALTGVAVLMLPFFVAASFLQVGNAANDSRMLGKHLNSRDEWATFLLPNMLYQGTKGFFRTIWTHSGPTAPFIHIISSFCLLLPQTLMEAVLVKFNHLSHDTLWTTDLEPLLPQSERNAVLKILSPEDSSARKYPEAWEASLMGHDSGVIRLEFFNYALALLVFSLRYANVFWHTNRAFSILFSVQLLINGIHSLISYASFELMYKLHVYGLQEAFSKSPPLLLNHHVTLLLYIISVTILLASSSVLYHYGYLKIAGFVRDKARTQFVSSGRDGHGLGWAYFPHCSAFAVLLALAATQSPLVHDATLIYGIILDNCMLTYVISTAVHLLVWILLWLSLTSKPNWKFDVNIHVGRLRVKELDSLKLAAEISLGDPADTTQPATPLSSSMLVVNEGQAFAVSDLNSKRDILELLLRNSQLRREVDSDERIYWPRPCSANGTQQSVEELEQPWLKEPSSGRNKVTFYDEISTQKKYASVPLTRAGGLRRSFRDQSYNQVSQDDDDGDYALLRRGKSCIKSPTIPAENEATRHQELISGMPGSTHPAMKTVYINNAQLNAIRRETAIAQTTPRSVLSTDSGYQGLSDACRSDSRSTGSSGSPPDRTVNSDSSGAHTSSTYTRTSSSPCQPQPSDCYCEAQQCYLDHSTYGKLGLGRTASIRSSVHSPREMHSHGKNPYSIYDTHNNASVPLPPAEDPYGETRLQRNSVCHNESLVLVASSLESPPYQPAMNSSPSLKYGNNINRANELQELQSNSNNDRNQSLYGESSVRVGRKSSMRRVTPNENPPIQTTPYGRCTNMKLNSFADQSIPPTPPPLPPLSFLSLSAAVSPMSDEHRTGDLMSPVETNQPPTYCSDHYLSRHTTLPNHVNEHQNLNMSPRENPARFHSPHGFKNGNLVQAIGEQ